MRATPEFKTAWLAPRYWPTWLAGGLMWLLAHLPYRVQMAIGSVIGRLAYRLAGKRRLVARKNLAQAFPELNETELEQLVKEVFRENAKAIPETCVAWFGKPKRLNVNWQVTGQTYAEQAVASGKGVLFVAAHFSCVDLCGAYAGNLVKADALHRPHNNPLMNYFQHRGRLRFVDNLVDRKDMRQMVRRLRQGRGIFYAPDQDLGRKRSLFVPFFNTPTATVTATSKLARLTGAEVILFLTRRTATGYELVLEPAPQLATGDEEQDLTNYNAWLEARIRETPSQYLWLHKRFKTRPRGEPPFYGVKGK